MSIGKRSLILAGALLITGCGWHRSLRFDSPGKTESIEVFQPRADPMLGLRVDFIKNDHRSTVLKAGETYIGFAHVYWSEPQSAFALLICGTRAVRMAYDRGSGKTISFDSFKRALDEDIKKTYGMDPAGFQPSQCVGSYYQDQFARRFSIAH